MIFAPSPPLRNLNPFPALLRDRCWWFLAVAMLLALASASYASPIPMGSPQPATQQPVVHQATTNCELFLVALKGYLVKGKRPATDADAIASLIPSNTMLHDAWSQDVTMDLHQRSLAMLTDARTYRLSPQVKMDVCDIIDTVTAGQSADDLKTTAWLVLYEYGLKERAFSAEAGRSVDWKNKPMSPAALQNLISTMMPGKAGPGGTVSGQETTAAAPGTAENAADLKKFSGGSWLGSTASCVSAMENKNNIGLVERQEIGGNFKPIKNPSEKTAPETATKIVKASFSGYQSPCLLLSPFPQEVSAKHADGFKTIPPGNTAPSPSPTAPAAGAKCDKTASSSSDDIRVAAACRDIATAAMLVCVGIGGAHVGNLDCADANIGSWKANSAKKAACDCRAKPPSGGTGNQSGAPATPPSTIAPCPALSAPTANYRNILPDPSPEVMRSIQALPSTSEMRGNSPR